MVIIGAALGFFCGALFVLAQSACRQPLASCAPLARQCV